MKVNIIYEVGGIYGGCNPLEGMGCYVLYSANSCFTRFPCFLRWLERGATTQTGWTTASFITYNMDMM